MIAPLLALLAGTPALAQTATAYAAFPYSGEPSGRHTVRLSDTDFLILRRANDTEYAIERYGEDLELLWSAPVRIPEDRPPMLGSGLRSVLGFDGNFNSWPDRALLVDDTQVSLVVAHEGGVRATRVDLESGAWLADEDILATTERPGLLLSDGQSALVAFSGGVRGAPIRAAVWDRSLTLQRALDIPHFDAARAVRVDTTGRRVEEYRVAFSINDHGDLFMAANPFDRQVVVRQLPAEGKPSTLVADFGDGELDTVALSFGPSGRAYVTGRVQDTKLLRTRYGGVAIGALDFDADRVSWLQVVSPDDYTLKLSRGAQPINEGLLELHTPTELLETPSGGVIFITQYQAIRTTTSTNSTTTTLEFEDLAVYAVSVEGELLWTSGLDVTQSVPAGLGGAQVGQLAWVTDESLRLVFMEFQPKVLGTERLISLREVSLADGAAAPLVRVAPLPSKYDIFFEQLTVILDDDTLVLASRVGVEEDMGLLTQVELSSAPPLSGPLMPALDPDPGDPAYRAGLIVGGQHALGAPSNTLFGLAKGGPITTAATVGGALFAPLAPAACVAGPVVGCAGGAAMAVLLTQGPGDAAVTQFSPEFQAGYVDGWARYARRKQLRWALVGAGAGALVAIVPVRLIANGLSSQ